MIAQGISIGEDMNKIDRLIEKAMGRTRLEDDDPYLGKTDAELLDYLSGENYRAPAMHTLEWSKFMYALIHAPHEDNGIERGEYCDEN